MKHPMLTLHLGYSGTILLIILVVGVFNPELLKFLSGNIKIVLDFGNKQETTLNVTNNTIPINNVIQQIFNDEATKRLFLVLLKEERDLYQPTDPEIVKAIGELKYDDKVSEGLRKLSTSHIGPFEEQGTADEPDASSEKKNPETKVRIRDQPDKKDQSNNIEQRTEVSLSVPAGNRIKQGKAASCRDNQFSRQDVKILNEQQKKSVTVFVGNSFDCPEKYKYLKDLIQLSYADMKELIGPSPLHRLEKGFAQRVISAQ